ncbi:hypothetical protein SEUCBS139899_008984 [Sporothrix eucalyptigena]|uniref:Arrestin-like N-terminal domain-containing protein n=1 Tax=Sporothrix eucalyptigena TaxID=1812306 RepID=A0ABP0AMH3_9PEZI
MKLAVFVDPPSNGKAFVPDEIVVGHIEIHKIKEGEEVPEVRVEFAGTIKVTLKPGLDAIAQIAGAVQHDSVTAQPTTDCNGNKTHHRVACFSFIFPSNFRCCGYRRLHAVPSQERIYENERFTPACPLPPSTHVKSSGVDAVITYTVTAVCPRPGRWNRLLKNRLRERCILTFAPPLRDIFDGVTCNELWLSADELLGRVARRLSRLTLPAYSPSISFRIVAPTPMILTPGHVSSIALIVKTPYDLLPRPGSPVRFFVRSIEFFLACHTVGRALSSQRRDTVRWPIAGHRPNIGLDTKVIACQVGKKLIAEQCRRIGCSKDDFPYCLFRIPADIYVSPNVETCCVTRQHCLEVVVGISAAPSPHKPGQKKPPAPTIYYRKESILVQLSEPPPTYTAPSNYPVVKTTASGEVPS